MSIKEVKLYPTLKGSGGTSNIRLPSAPDSVKGSFIDETSSFFTHGVTHKSQSQKTGYYKNTVYCGDATPTESNASELCGSGGWKIKVKDHYGTSNSYHASNFYWGNKHPSVSSSMKNQNISPYPIVGAAFNLKNSGTNDANSIQIVEMKFYYASMSSNTSKDKTIEVTPNGNNSGSYKFRRSFSKGTTAGSHNMGQLKMGKNIDLWCWHTTTTDITADYENDLRWAGLSVSFWVGDTGSPDRNYEYTISNFTPIYYYSDKSWNTYHHLVYPKPTPLDQQHSGDGASRHQVIQILN